MCRCILTEYYEPTEIRRETGENFISPVATIAVATFTTAVKICVVLLLFINNILKMTLKFPFEQ